MIGYLTSTETHLHISVFEENCSLFWVHFLSGTTLLNSLNGLIGVIPNLRQQSIFSSLDNSASVYIYVLPDYPSSKRDLKLLDLYNIKFKYNLITNY